MHDDATFVFEGTISRLNASTVATVTPTASTAVVQVDRAVRVAPAFEYVVGREITIVLDSRATVGTTMVFSAVGWVFGDSLAVIELEREPITAAAADRTPSQDREAMWARAARERVQRANQVVLGQVRELRPHPNARPRLSEHDPDWWIAEVDVETSFKGARSRTVPVTFANSRDVMWSRAPKLRPAQKSILVLHQGDEELPDRRSRGVLHTQDVHAPDKIAAIVDMI